MIIGAGIGSVPAWLEPLGRILKSNGPREGLARLCSRVCSREFLSVPVWEKVFGRFRVEDTPKTIPHLFVIQFRIDPESSQQRPRIISSLNVALREGGCTFLHKL